MNNLKDTELKKRKEKPHQFPHGYLNILQQSRQIMPHTHSSRGLNVELTISIILPANWSTYTVSLYLVFRSQQKYFTKGPKTTLTSTGNHTNAAGYIIM